MWYLEFGGKGKTGKKKEKKKHTQKKTKKKKKQKNIYMYLDRLVPITSDQIFILITLIDNLLK